MDLYRRCSKVEALEGGYREQSVPFVLTANKTRCNVGFSMTTGSDDSDRYTAFRSRSFSIAWAAL